MTARARATDGVTIDPVAVHVADLAPGGTAVRTVTVGNGSDVAVVVRWHREETGALLGGDAPTGVTYAWAGSGPTCDGDPVLAPGERRELTLVATMPADAGDEYQAATGSSALTVLAEQHPAGCGTPGEPVALDGPGTGDALAVTGGQAGGLLLAGVLLLAAGAALRRRTRGGAPA